MKTYKLAFLTETESNTEIEEINTFTDLKIAKKEFKTAVKYSYRGRCANEEDFKEYLTESIVLEEWVDDEYETTLLQQVIYSEGIIDRMNYKGNHASWYYSRATFNGEELMHTMYFQGEKQMWSKKHKVPQSQINNWYYR